MMTEFFYDTYAIIELFKANQDYVKYFSEHDGITAFTNSAEVYYIMLKEAGEEKAKSALDFVRKLTVFPEFEIIEEAMNFRFKNIKHKFSYADCIGYAIAKQKRIKFLTGDKQFKDFPNVVFVK